MTPPLPTLHSIPRDETLILFFSLCLAGLFVTSLLMVCALILDGRL